MALFYIKYMEILIKASQFILSLSLLIVLHELGHFIPAKLFKTRVEKFFLFFDTKFALFKKKIGETEYGIGWIPLGGYVKIAGMIDESMDTEHLKQEPQPWEFRSKPAWQRLIIMLGGVFVNFVLGWFLYIMITGVWGNQVVKSNGLKYGFAVADTFLEYGFQNGDQILKINEEVPESVMDINRDLFLRTVHSVEVLHTNGEKQTISIPENIGKIMWENGTMKPFSPRMIAKIDSILPDNPAAKAGLLKTDKIVTVNGKKIDFWNDFTSVLDASEGKINLEVNRNGVLKTLEIIPTEKKKIGISVTATEDDIIDAQQIDYGFSESISKGTSLAYWTLKDYITQFKYVFTKKGAQSIGGFIAIGNIFPAYWSWEAFWRITAFLSIMLGFMNLLPIPALDGGHVMFTLWEMVTGKKPSDKFLEYAQVAGFVLLVALLLLANGNDIVKLFK